MRIRMMMMMKGRWKVDAEIGYKHRKRANSKSSQQPGKHNLTSKSGHKEPNSFKHYKKKTNNKRENETVTLPTMSTNNIFF